MQGKPEQVQTQPKNALDVQTSHGFLLYLHSKLFFFAMQELDIMCAASKDYHNIASVQFIQNKNSDIEKNSCMEKNCFKRTIPVWNLT